MNLEEKAVSDIAGSFKIEAYQDRIEFAIEKLRELIKKDLLKKRRRSPAAREKPEGQKKMLDKSRGRGYIIYR